MNRKERLARGRAELLRKAVVQAGYLTGKEGDEAKRAMDFDGLMVDVLTDLIHLGATQFGLEIVGVTVGEKGQYLLERLTQIGRTATTHFLDETID